MHPRYEKSTGKLVIEWYEKRKNASPVHHFYSQKPARLQLHPRNEDQIIRANFADKMPSWFEDYAKEFHFKCQQVTRNGEVGFWMANWRSYPAGQKPFTSPNIMGAFEQFARRIPEVCDNLKQQVLSNREVIEKNLLNYPTAFEDLGIFYRPEEIKGEGGAVVFDDIIPLRETEDDDESYRSRIEMDGRLERLIYELITPLPDPIIEEEDTAREESDDDLIPDFDETEEESLENITFEDESEEELNLDGLEFEDEGEEDGLEFTDLTEDDETITLEPESEETINIEEPFEMENLDYEETMSTIEALTEESAIESSPHEVSTEQNKEDISEDPQEDPIDDQETVESSSSSFGAELKVTDEVDKKIVEGQFSLF